MTSVIKEVDFKANKYLVQIIWGKISGIRRVGTTGRFTYLKEESKMYANVKAAFLVEHGELFEKMQAEYLASKA